MPRFPLTLQHDSMQCGIACLQMVCNHYGRDYSLGYLEQICHATTEGVSLLGISETATRLGLHTVYRKALIDKHILICLKTFSKKICQKLLLFTFFFTCFGVVITMCTRVFTPLRPKRVMSRPYLSNN